MSLTQTYTLTNGVQIPVVGFGTWQTPDGDVAVDSVVAALKAGYRHIDTAAIYRNEASVGAAIHQSGVDRKDIFVTTKLWNDKHSYEGAHEAINTSLEKLGLDYIDLYLIHWPNPIAVRENWKHANAEAWRAMEEMLESGKVRAIGVSNFMPHHIDALLETATVKPMVNQIYLNPLDQQKPVVAKNQEHGIITEAYSPLGTGNILNLEALQTIAAKYERSVAQLVLRWSLQKGFLPLPKSVTPSRIVENANLFDFEISNADMHLIDALEDVEKNHNDPDSMNF